MNREIKFRYVIKHIKTGNILMFERSLSDIEHYGSLEWMCEMVLGIIIIDGYDLLSRDEYTCLKDKNDKEIYEGDFCSILTQTYQVVWRGIGFWFMDIYSKELFVFDQAIYDIGIIGNIHENPELLTLSL